MTFDFSSFLNTWVCCLLLNWALGRINQGYDRSRRFRHRFLTFLYWLIIIRMLVPANFIVGIPSPLSPWMRQADAWLSAPLGHLPLSAYAVLSYIWLFGAVYSLIIYYVHREQEKEVARGLIERSRIIPIQDLVEDYAGPDFTLCLSKDIETPFVYGYSSVILIPDRNYTEDQLFYIVSHETMHLFNGDAGYCLLVQILTRVYWWMPGLSSLRKNTSSMIELRVDGTLMELYSKADLLGYCETLIRVSHPDFNPLVSDMGPENAYIGNKRMFYPPMTQQDCPASSETVKENAKNLEVLAFGEPNTDLETRIHYCLSAHEKPKTPAAYYILAALVPFLSALCLGMQCFLPF